MWGRWTIYDISQNINSLPEGATAMTLLPGILEGLNHWEIAGYNGPCPPVGQHRYFSKFYA
jgi:hypothetical protein